MLRALREQNRIVGNKENRTIRARLGSPHKNVYEVLKGLEGYIGGEWEPSEGGDGIRVPLVDKAVRNFCDETEILIGKIINECGFVDHVIFRVEAETESELRAAEKDVADQINERARFMKKLGAML